jgi:hypothetical protein
MRTVLSVSVFLLILGIGKGNAQSVRSAGISAGVQIFNSAAGKKLFSLGHTHTPNTQNFFSTYQLFPFSTKKNHDLSQPSGVRKPVANFCESRSIALSNRLQVGADVVFLKNTINYDFAKATLLEVLYTSMPVYLDVYLTPDFFLEGGAYAGLQANSGNVRKTEFVQAAYIEDIDLNWDAGFVAGVGLDVAGLGKLRLRYNHGLLKIVPIDRQTIVRNRIVEIGVAIVL